MSNNKYFDRLETAAAAYVTICDDDDASFQAIIDVENNIRFALFEFTANCSEYNGMDELARYAQQCFRNKKDWHGIYVVGQITAAVKALELSKATRE